MQFHFLVGALNPTSIVINFLKPFNYSSKWTGIKHGHWNFTTNSVFKASGLTLKKILEKRNKMNIY